MAAAEESYESIRNSLARFLDENQLDSAACVSSLDDIIMGYIAGILDDLAEEDCSDFDVEDFVEMIAPYCPGIGGLPQVRVLAWVCGLATERKAPQEPKKKIVSLLDLNCSIPVTIGSPEADSSASRRIRTQHWSETSESSQSSDDASISFQQLQIAEEEISTLKKLFPAASLAELRHCLALAGGDIPDAAQWVLQRMESGESLKGALPRSNMASKARKDISVKDDENLKKLIISKYSYVDQDDDKKEYRPPPLKSEPKKMVRYRDSQVVTIKGEKYTEVKSKEPEEMKKTYVNIKPARQYRFH